MVLTPKNREELAKKTGRKATATLTIGEEEMAGFEKARSEKKIA